MNSEAHERLKALQEPFPLESVGFKPQVISKKRDKAMVATYIDARAVALRLDEVFPFAWNDEYIVRLDDQKRLVLECALTLFNEDVALTRRDVGESDNSDKQASRWKSAYSDAFKRAAVKFGIGSYLYNLGQNWVEYEEWAPNKGKITDNGIKQAERAYQEAVKALGYDVQGKKSQGQIETPESEADGESTSQEKPKPIGKARGDAMLKELEKIGFDIKNFHELAKRVLDRKVPHFATITEDEAAAVWRAAKEAVEPPKDGLKDFEPKPTKTKQADGDAWQSWRSAEDAITWALGQHGGDGAPIFGAHTHANNAYKKARREYGNSLPPDDNGNAGDMWEYWWQQCQSRAMGGETYVLPTHGSQPIPFEVDAA